MRKILCAVILVLMFEATLFADGNIPVYSGNFTDIVRAVENSGTVQVWKQHYKNSNVYTMYFGNGRYPENNKIDFVLMPKPSVFAVDITADDDDTQAAILSVILRAAGCKLEEMDNTFEDGNTIFFESKRTGRIFMLTFKGRTVSIETDKSDTSDFSDYEPSYPTAYTGSGSDSGGSYIAPDEGVTSPRIPCYTCRGRKEITCSACNGKKGRTVYHNAPPRYSGIGKALEHSHASGTWEPCSKCYGSGKMQCTSCHGTGWAN